MFETVAFLTATMPGVARRQRDRNSRHRAAVPSSHIRPKPKRAMTMATYWLTFRIEERSANYRSDDARRDALYDVIRNLAHTKWWVEPTSFILFESELRIDDIASSVREVVAPEYDIVLIRDAENKAARVIGPVDPDLFLLMPYAQEA